MDWSRPKFHARSPWRRRSRAPQPQLQTHTARCAHITCVSHPPPCPQPTEEKITGAPQLQSMASSRFYTMNNQRSSLMRMSSVNAIAAAALAAVGEDIEVPGG